MSTRTARRGAPTAREVEQQLVKTSPHEVYRELQGKLPLAQLHHPNSGMSDDVAGVGQVEKRASPEPVVNTKNTNLIN